jgi:hypothetical protein
MSRIFCEPFTVTVVTPKPPSGAARLNLVCPDSYPREPAGARWRFISLLVWEDRRTNRGEPEPRWSPTQTSLLRIVSRLLIDSSDGTGDKDVHGTVSHPIFVSNSRMDWPVAGCLVEVTRGESQSSRRATRWRFQLMGWRCALSGRHHASLLKKSGGTDSQYWRCIYPLRQPESPVKASAAWLLLPFGAWRQRSMAGRK